MAAVINSLNDPNATAASQDVRQQNVQNRGTDFQSLMQALAQNKTGSTEERIKNAVNDSARKYNLPPALVLGFIKQESGFKPNARSWCGAQGLMQLMPATARGLGVQDPWSIEQNIDGGCKYIRQMLDRFDGDLKRAVAAYNAGPGAVDKYNGVPPYKETRDYVPAVLAHYEKFAGGAVDFTVPGDYAPAQRLDLNLVADAVQSSEMMTQAATALAITGNIKPIDLPKPSRNDDPPPPPPPGAVRV